jgi:hypothetical protein
MISFDSQSLPWRWYLDIVYTEYGVIMTVGSGLIAVIQLNKYMTDSNVYGSQRQKWTYLDLNLFLIPIVQLGHWTLKIIFLHEFWAPLFKSLDLKSDNIT